MKLEQKGMNSLAQALESLPRTNVCEPLNPAWRSPLEGGGAVTPQPLLSLRDFLRDRRAWPGGTQAGPGVGTHTRCNSVSPPTQLSRCHPELVPGILGGHTAF